MPVQMTPPSMEFLDIFASHRRLKEDLAASDLARVHAEDEFRFWRAKADVYEQDAREAKAEALKSHRMFINWQAQRISGFDVFPNEGPRLPEKQFDVTETSQESAYPSRRLARDVANEETAKFNTFLDQELTDYQRSQTQN